ncbi:MAG: class I SAM-dependent methyltransferase, partial [Patescibacteria group bacterium]
MGNTEMSMSGQIKNCRICGNYDLKQFFDLGTQPPPDILLKRKDDVEEKYPLSLVLCPDCRLVQLDYTVSPEKLFSHYVWVTGTARGTREYAERFCKEVAERVKIPKDGYVLEVASNDGTFLKPFIRAGYAVLGVDPAKNLAEAAEREGIPTKAVFWGTKEAKKVRNERGPAHVIFARNVLPHVANTVDFVRGLRECLHDQGVLVIEAHYAKIILDELHYDSIYHEHLCYFTLKSLERLLEDAGLYIFDIMKSPISGGSIVVYVRKNKGGENPALAEYRAQEEREKINELASWKTFAEKAKKHRDVFLGTLRDIASKGGSLIGWGASARSSTL